MNHPLMTLSQFCVDCLKSMNSSMVCALLTMLFALLLGIAMNFLAADGKCKAGIEFTARAVLRLGIALLGMRITLEQIATLGWKPVVLVVVVVVATIAVSVVAAKVLGFKRIFGMLTGGGHGYLRRLGGIGPGCR